MVTWGSVPPIVGRWISEKKNSNENGKARAKSRDVIDQITQEAALSLWLSPAWCVSDECPSAVVPFFFSPTLPGGQVTKTLFWREIFQEFGCIFLGNDKHSAPRDLWERGGRVKCFGCLTTRKSKMWRIRPPALLTRYLSAADHFDVIEINLFLKSRQKSHSQVNATVHRIWLVGTFCVDCWGRQ